MARLLETRSVRVVSRITRLLLLVCAAFFFNALHVEASRGRRQHRSLVEELEEHHGGQRRLREQGFLPEEAEAVVHGLVSNAVGRSDDPTTGISHREFHYETAHGARVDYVADSKMKPGAINLDDIMGDIDHVSCNIFMTAKAQARDKATSTKSQVRLSCGQHGCGLLPRRAVVPEPPRCLPLCYVRLIIPRPWLSWPGRTLPGLL